MTVAYSISKQSHYNEHGTKAKGFVGMHSAVFLRLIIWKYNEINYVSLLWPLMSGRCIWGSITTKPIHGIHHYFVFCAKGRLLCPFKIHFLNIHTPAINTSFPSQYTIPSTSRGESILWTLWRQRCSTREGDRKFLTLTRTSKLFSKYYEHKPLCYGCSHYFPAKTWRC